MTKPIKSNPDWIKARLNEAGYTLTSLAREYGVTRHVLKLALHRPYPKAERIIAKALDLDPWEIWPDRYTDKKPNRRRGKPISDL